MKAQNNAALKEWSVVNRALREGRQVVLLRKGGVVEKDGAFKLEQEEFFVFPTLEHQDPADLQDRFKDWPEDALRLKPPEGQLELDTYLRADTVLRLNDFERLKRLLPLTVWSESFLRKRLDYKPEKPLHVVIARAYRTPHPYRVPLDPDYAGCTSWVTLKQELSPTRFYPVFSAEVFAEHKKRVLEALGA
jgi:hypothetical protein